jgi:hypothetical protein
MYVSEKPASVFFCFIGGRPDEHLSVRFGRRDNVRRVLRRLPPELLLTGCAGPAAGQRLVVEERRSGATRVQRDVPLGGCLVGFSQQVLHPVVKFLTYL